MRGLKSPEPFTYAFAQLPMRDEVVFKSIVGLLAGRTQSQWQHVQGTEADLLVLGGDRIAEGSRPCTARAVLKVTQQRTDSSELAVHWPLRANEVFERLEQIARLLNQAGPGSHAFDPLCSYRLASWPTQEILGQTPANLRLATLLSARACNLEQLSARSAVELEDCLRLLRNLYKAGLLLEQVSASKVATTPTPPGFFARLRAHLGLTAR
ncbi:hypothetical protein [Pseudomonas sp. 5P_3.1_Bac2]|uniref:hypothetical protein n=1 Tax=Pseudomonas sp. 5P_3.1_Bac2 TaxID=2971617 RepID=UPI0021C95A3F|nr:hypothetical protein [Pseudomonas sp. 5P_3.1_Bac2]MCU1718474.1 hypothetical protein [Pseudomonas sp. 5P_3.1_Bac2]